MNSYDEAQETQATDEANAVITGRMFRQLAGQDEDGADIYRVVIKNLHTNKIAGDFTATMADDGVIYADANAIVSRVGERHPDSTFKGGSWQMPKDVRYNTLTHEITVQQAVSRKRNG